MSARSELNGREVIFDESRWLWVYVDTGERVKPPVSNGTAGPGWGYHRDPRPTGPTWEADKEEARLLDHIETLRRHNEHLAAEVAWLRYLVEMANRPTVFYSVDDYGEVT